MNPKALLPLIILAILAVCTDSQCTTWPCTNENGNTVADCDTSGATDYFPYKVSSDHTVKWEISYHKYYKVISYSSNTYVLVQDGCPTPVGVTGTVVNVPASKVAITSSSYEAYIELINERSSVVSRTGLYTSSPCMNKLIEDGHIEDISSSCNNGATIQFGSNWGAIQCINATAVQVEEWGEQGLLPQLEWVEYFAVFFNKEEEVENYLVSTETAISCAKIAVEDHARERRANGLYKKQVLWATPNYNHPGVWSKFGTSPNYYEDAITSAGGVFINDHPSIIALAARVEHMVGDGQIAQNTEYTNGTISTSASHNLLIGDLVELYDTGCYCSSIYTVLTIPSTTTLTITSDATVTDSSMLVLKPSPVGDGSKCVGSWGSGCVIRKAVSDAELAAIIGDVDIILAEPTALSDDTCKAAYAGLSNSVPAKKNQQIYDYGKVVDPASGFDFLGSRFAEPDVLIEDLIQVFYPEMRIRNETIWFQNVFTERACLPATLPTVASLASECPSTDAPFNTMRTSACSTGEVVTPASEGSSDNKSTAERLWYVWLILSVVVVFLCTPVVFFIIRLQKENAVMSRRLLAYQTVASNEGIESIEGIEGIDGIGEEGVVGKVGEEVV